MKFIKTFLSAFVFALSFGVVQIAFAVNFNLPIPVNPDLPSGTLSATNCTIQANASSCNTTLNWTTTNTNANSRVRVYNSSTYTTPGYPDSAVQQGAFVAGTNTPNTTTNANLSGTNVVASMPYGTKTLELYDIRSIIGNQPDPNNNQWNLFKFASVSQTASCAVNTAWNGTVCSSTLPSAGIVNGNCIIPSGASTCNIAVYWSSVNTTSPSIRQNGIQFSTLANQPPSVTRTITFGTPANNVFTFYDGTTLLNTATATGYCATGTTWNGTLCYLPVQSATITSTPTCNLENSHISSTAIDAFCNINLTWSTSNVASPLVISSPGNSQVSLVASGSVTKTIRHAPSTFYVYNGSVNTTPLAQTTSAGVCNNSTTWNGTYCAPVLTSTPTCTIAANASTCNVNVSWQNSGNPTNVQVRKDSLAISTTANQSTPISTSISYGSHTFSIYLLNWATIAIATSSSTAGCISGTTWNGTTCASSQAAIIASTPTCTLPANALAACQVNVTWSSSGVTTPVVKKTTSSPLYTTTISSSANQTTAIQQLVGYGNNTFEIYDGTTLLDSSVSVGVCPVNTTWNGTICATPPTAWISGTNICTIAANASTCTVGMYWGSTNVTSPSIRQNGVQFATNANQTSSSPISRTITYGNGASNTFTFYDGTTLLATSAASGSCISGTTWNGTICSTGNGGTISSTPSCIIPIGGSTCTIYVTWSSTGLTSPLVNSPNWSSPYSNSPTSVIQPPLYVPYGTYTFNFYDGSTLIASSISVVSCASGSIWNGTICSNSPMASIVSNTSCIIASGASTCNVYVTWSSNFTSSNRSIKQDGVQFSTLANQSTPVTRAISIGSHLFSYYDGTQLLSAFNSSASCISGNYWNGTMCTPGVSPATGTITSTPTCLLNWSIPFCSVTVTWSSTNTTNPSIRQDGIQFSTSTSQTMQRSISGGTGPYNVPPGTHTFDFYDNGTLLSTATSTASCNPNDPQLGTGLYWYGPGNSCVGTFNTGYINIWSTPPFAPPLSSPPTCYIPVNGNSCNVNVTWHGGQFNNTVNPSIKQDGTTFSTLGSNFWPGVTRSLLYGTHTFDLYSSTSLMWSKSATAVCTSGTTWNGTLCVSANPSLTGIISSTPSCTILAGSGDCSVNVTWSSTGLSNPSVKKDGTILATSLSGSTLTNITNGSHTFALSDGTVLVDSSTSVATCEPNSHWNGTYCSIGSISLTPTTTPSCIIAANASSCNVNVSWYSSGTTNPKVTKIGGLWFSALNSTQISTLPSSSSPQPVPMEPNNAASFVLYDGTIILDTVAASATCISGTMWDGDKCAYASIHVSPSSCLIDPYGFASATSSCDVYVYWSSAGLTSPNVKKDGTAFSTATYGWGWTASLTDGSHTFDLYDGTTLVDTAYASASCDSGSTWDGTDCTFSSSRVISLTASSTNTTAKKPVNLTWSAPDAAYCTGNGFNTNNLTSGTVSVSPQATTTYSVTCYDANGAPQTEDEKVTIGKLKTRYSLGTQLTNQPTATVVPTCSAGTVLNTQSNTCESTAKASIEVYLTDGSTSPNLTCSIPAGGNTCDVTVSWSGQGMDRPAVKLNGVKFSSQNQNRFPGTQMTLKYGKNYFTIYQGSTLLDTATVEVLCQSGVWDGVSCASSSSSGGSGGSGSGFGSSNNDNGSVYMCPATTISDPAAESCAPSKPADPRNISVPPSDNPQNTLRCDQYENCNYVCEGTYYPSNGSCSEKWKCLCTSAKGNFYLSSQ